MNINYDTTHEEYVAVLKNQVETLRRYYFNPYAEGTGHFNTAISVLEHRIKEIEESKNA